MPVNNFSYTGLTGPLNWFGLNKTANVLCSTGTHQSPIDIGNSSGVWTAPGNSIKVSIPDYPSSALFEYLGTTVEVVVNGKLVEDKRFIIYRNSISTRLVSTVLTMSTLLWRCISFSKQQV